MTSSSEQAAPWLTDDKIAEYLVKRIDGEDVPVLIEPSVKEVRHCFEEFVGFDAQFAACTATLIGYRIDFDIELVSPEERVKLIQMRQCIPR